MTEDNGTASAVPLDVRVVMLISATEAMTVGPNATPIKMKITAVITPITVLLTILPILDIFLITPYGNAHNGFV